MRWPHQSCRETHQSRMLSSQPYHVFSCSFGMILSSPLRTASVARLAIPEQSTHHCGLSIGSMTSPVREQTPSRILLSASPRNSPRALSSASTATRASKRIMPEKLPQPSAILPSSVKIVISSRPWRRPQAKSFASCAGVTLTAPVPKLMSTRVESVMIRSLRSTNGWTSVRPCSCLYRGSSGCTATATSPSIVSGRVVAMTTSSSDPSTLYANDQIRPKTYVLSFGWPGTVSRLGFSRSS
mmetsp:Transcript_22038/g.71080  ORF Transcript_22038/g.71080 Transcript_22038/m.71080 type:complete len:241 (-) Transcript_22038:719-1441(-)